jgi:hypothetical protein
VTTVRLADVHHGTDRKGYDCDAAIERGRWYCEAETAGEGG